MREPPPKKTRRGHSKYRSSGTSHGTIPRKLPFIYTYQPMNPCMMSLTSCETNWKTTSSKVVKPKRPLSAYNFFFKIQRARILQVAPTRKEGKPLRSHGKIGFKELATEISRRWKVITPEELAHYERLAKQDKERYVWETKALQQRREDARLAFLPSATNTPMTMESYLTMQQQHCSVKFPPSSSSSGPLSTSAGMPWHSVEPIHTNASSSLSSASATTWDPCVSSNSHVSYSFRDEESGSGMPFHSSAESSSFQNKTELEGLAQELGTDLVNFLVECFAHYHCDRA